MLVSVEFFILCVLVHSLLDKSTGTDVNAALKRFEDRMAWIEEREKENFRKHRHVFLLFTDGNYESSFTFFLSPYFANTSIG